MAAENGHGRLGAGAHQGTSVIRRLRCSWRRQIVCACTVREKNVEPLFGNLALGRSLAPESYSISIKVRPLETVGGVGVGVFSSLRNCHQGTEEPPGLL